MKFRKACRPNACTSDATGLAPRSGRQPGISSRPLIHQEQIRPSKRLAIRNWAWVGCSVSLSPDYHRRQATALTHIAETSRDPELAKALLRIASEQIVQADEAERTLALARMTNKDRPT